MAGAAVHPDEALAQAHVHARMLAAAQPLHVAGRRRDAVQVKAALLATKFSTRFAAPPPPVSAMHIVCSPAVFRTLWVVIVLFQLILCVALLRAIYSNVWTLMDHEEVDLALRNFGGRYNGSVMVGTTLVTAGSIYVNLTDVIRYVRCSIRHRRLVFQNPKVTNHRSRTSTRTQTRTETHATSRPQRWTTWMRVHVAMLFAPAISYSRACGIHGAFFDVGLYARELLEIVLQTYQTWRVSYSVSEPWINNFAVGLVVANCWTTPLLDLWLSHNEALRRAMCMVVDLLLDTMSALALPMLVFASYRSKVATIDWFDPLWITDTGNDLQYFHINTWLDLFSRTMPSVSLIHCVHSVTPMLVRRGPAKSGPTSSRTSARVSSTVSTRTTSSKATPMVVVTPQPRIQPKRSPVPVKVTNRRKATLIHKLMLLYGAIILAMGVLAQHGPQLSPELDGCQKISRPWLLGTERFPCSVLELNCAAYPELDDATGNSYNARLERADRSALQALVITHCPHVRMPSQIAVFRNLIWLEVYNSTIIEWPEAAALTQSRHPRMSRILMTRVNVSPLLAPVNVLMERVLAGPMVPPTLLDIAIAASDLSQWVDVNRPTICTRDRRLHSLLLEDCQLAKIPSTLSTETLSLARNPVDNISSLGNSLQSATLFALETQIRNCSSLPTSPAIVFAAGAPICTMSSSTSKQMTCGSVRLDCSKKLAVIPLEKIDARRSIARGGWVPHS